MARPTKHTPELLIKAQEYADNWKTIGDAIPMICGLAIHCGISTETVYQWLRDDDKQEFADICACVRASQERGLVNGGLGRTFDSGLSKLLLGKHGYSDKQEIDHTTNGKDIVEPKVALADRLKELGISTE